MELIVVVISLIILLVNLRKNRKDKLEFLYDTVITQSYCVFFRASKRFILQKNLSEKDRANVEKSSTKATDYNMLINATRRCKNMFCKTSNFYKHLSDIEKECHKRLDNEFSKIYDDGNKSLNNLFNLHKESIRGYYILFDWQQSDDKMKILKTTAMVKFIIKTMDNLNEKYNYYRCKKQ